MAAAVLNLRFITGQLSGHTSAESSGFVVLHLVSRVSRLGWFRCFGASFPREQYLTFFCKFISEVEFIVTEQLTLPNLRSHASKQETDFSSPIPKTPFFCNLFQSHAVAEAVTNLKVSTILTSWSFPVLFLFVARCCPSFRSAERFQSRWWQLTKLLSLTFWCKFSN